MAAVYTHSAHHSGSCGAPCHSLELRKGESLDLQQGDFRRHDLDRTAASTSRPRASLPRYLQRASHIDKARQTSSTTASVCTRFCFAKTVAASLTPAAPLPRATYSLQPRNANGTSSTQRRRREQRIDGLLADGSVLTRGRVGGRGMLQYFEPLRVLPNSPTLAATTNANEGMARKERGPLEAPLESPPSDNDVSGMQALLDILARPKLCIGKISDPTGRTAREQYTSPWTIVALPAEWAPCTITASFGARIWGLAQKLRTPRLGLTLDDPSSYSPRHTQPATGARRTLHRSSLSEQRSMQACSVTMEFVVRRESWIERARDVCRNTGRCDREELDRMGKASLPEH
ncbi:hypothetical protein BDV95DRAFT_589548 [Massariosphaeria phaeospora]|uniref:Uncharacterized protein n=1 Tax=Massariosphaeria phaeospora TaxID=100035 RepID=A0A7C8IDI0_9PLEO|nr:hypothetical protein BDV95DRAFT_589548 [Massariosphaeria phaeospora]